MIIPNWNGMQFIDSCLPGVINAARECEFPTEILVVDDASTDGSPDLIRQKYPEVRLEQNLINLGFGATVNKGAGLSTGQFIALLNNDLKPDIQMLNSMMSHLLNDQDVFGVTARCLASDTQEPNHVNMTGRFEAGQFRLAWSNDAGAAETMFLQGGSSIVRRTQFLEWAGFCPLFAPGYWEDYDLSYFALKTGMKNIYEPRAIGYHYGQGSMIRAHGHDRILRIRERNAHLFLALNLTDPDLLKAWLRTLPAQLTTQSHLRVLHRFENCFSIMGAGSAIARERKRRASYIKVADATIFEKFAQHGRLCP